MDYGAVDGMRSLKQASTSRDFAFKRLGVVLNGWILVSVVSGLRVES